MHVASFETIVQLIMCNKRSSISELVAVAATMLKFDESRRVEVGIPAISTV